MIEQDMSAYTRELWYDGANHAADAVVMTPTHVLLIQRGDTGRWALPGGFIENGEDSLTAARREAFEEAGITLDGSSGQVYSGFVDDRRNSATAWVETDAHLFELPHRREVTGGDDAQDAGWFPLAGLSDRLSGTHLVIVEKALALRSGQEALRHVIEQPGEQLRRTVLTGGHMSYDHLLVTDADGETVFVKIHDPTRFNDPVRERHSREYLAKEEQMVDYLRSRDFPHVPSRSLLIDGHTLVMDGYPSTDGWIWDAPDDSTFTEYLDSCLAALEELESVPLDREHSPVVPTLQSMRADGWSTLGNGRQQAAAKKLKSFMPRMDDRFRQLADDLARALPALHAAYVPASEENIVMAHHDMRSSNIAWHPVHGVRIVDWSWAGAGSPGSDRTTLLIDAAKAGHDVAPWLKGHFNQAHALEMIGFWLANSLRPANGNDSVRFQQALSAVAAYGLLEQING